MLDLLVDLENIYILVMSLPLVYIIFCSFFICFLTEVTAITTITGHVNLTLGEFVTDIKVQTPFIHKKHHLTILLT